MAMCKKVTTSQVAMCKKVNASHGNVLKKCTFASKRVHFMIPPMGVIIILKQCHGNVMGMAPKNAQELSRFPTSLPSRVRRLKFSRFVISDPGFLLAPTPGPDYLWMSSTSSQKRCLIT